MSTSTRTGCPNCTEYDISKIVVVLQSYYCKQNHVTQLFAQLMDEVVVFMGNLIIITYSVQAKSYKIHVLYFYLFFKISIPLFFIFMYDSLHYVC